MNLAIEQRFISDQNQAVTTCPFCKSKEVGPLVYDYDFLELPPTSDCPSCGERVLFKCPRCQTIQPMREWFDCRNCDYTTRAVASPQAPLEKVSSWCGYAVMAVAVVLIPVDVPLAIGVGFIGVLLAGWWKGGFP